MGPGGGALGTGALQPAASAEMEPLSARCGGPGDEEQAASLLDGNAGPALPTRPAASVGRAACAGAVGVAGSAAADGADAASRGPASEVAAGVMISIGPEDTLAT
mmetsp:Transcript_165700/g.318129  ORF Transcript_165700/g.318129 Transcript_165700/m.318129 type:complete len:105 (+) Transcript_165700:1295-1609(+)